MHNMMQAPPTADIPWIPITAAMAMTGRSTRESFRCWLRRHNRKNPHALVRRTRQSVNRADLLKALDAEAVKCTPSYQVAAALEASAARSARRGGAAR